MLHAAIVKFFDTKQSTPISAVCSQPVTYCYRTGTICTIHDIVNQCFNFKLMPNAQISFLWHQLSAATQ